IQNLNGVATDANSVFGQISQTLSNVDDTLGLFERILEKDNSGQRHVVRVIVQKLAQDQGPALGIVTDLGESVVNDQLDELEPTLANIESQLHELRSQFTQIRTQIGTVALDSDFDQSLSIANHDAQALQGYLQQASYAVSNLLNDVVATNGDYFTSNP